MRTKKFAVILVAIVFVLVMLFSCIALFAVKKVEVNFAVSDNAPATEVQTKLDEFLGDSLIFLDEQEVIDSISEFHYMEVMSVTKNFPNALEIEIKERREVYEIVSGQTVYVTTDDGLLLRAFDISEQTESRDRIKIDLKDISVTEVNLGKPIVTSNNDLLTKVFEMAKSVELTNCIKSVGLEQAPAYNGIATFNTYTGVNIIIRDILVEDGVKKIQTAFDKYEGATDYEKNFKQIEVVILSETGEIVAQWTKEDGLDKEQA